MRSKDYTRIVLQDYLQTNGELLMNSMLDLSVKLDKCELVTFGSGKPREIKWMDVIISFKTSCKYLGVHIDGWLRFNEHIDYVVIILNKFCGLLYKIRHSYNTKFLVIFYISLSKFVMCYGVLI